MAEIVGIRFKRAGRVYYFDPADIELARKDEKIKLISQPGMNVGYLSFNHTKEPWKSNVHLRRAIAHAINRKAIVDNIYHRRPRGSSSWRHAGRAAR